MLVDFTVNMQLSGTTSNGFLGNNLRYLIVLFIFEGSLGLFCLNTNKAKLKTDMNIFKVLFTNYLFIYGITIIPAVFFLNISFFKIKDLVSLIFIIAFIPYVYNLNKRKCTCKVK